MPSHLKRIGCAAAFVTAIVLNACSTAPAATLEEYRSLIADCRRAAEQDKISESRLKILRTRLSAVRTVIYPGGRSIEVNTRPLVAALRNISDDVPAHERFASLETLLTSGGGRPSRGNPREQANHILAAGEFAALRKPVKPVQAEAPNWWVRFTRWVKKSMERFGQWLDKILRTPPAPRSESHAGVQTLVKFLQFLLWFLLGVAAVAALYLLGRHAAARGWLGALRRRRRGGGDLNTGLDLSGDGIPDPLGAARALAGRGAYREAVRMAYIACLRRLNEDGLLVLTPNKTNWEYQRELRLRSREASDTLLSATRLFDHIWYGLRTGTEAEFLEVVKAHEALGTVRIEAPAQQEEADSFVVGDAS